MIQVDYEKFEQMVRGAFISENCELQKSLIENA